MYDIYDLMNGCSTFDELNGIESNLIIVKVIKKGDKYYTQF